MMTLVCTKCFVIHSFKVMKLSGWLTLIFNLQEVFCAEVLIWCIAPQVFAHYLVQLLSKGFSQAVSQCLHHDVVVVITLSGNGITAHDSGASQQGA